MSYKDKWSETGRAGLQPHASSSSGEETPPTLTLDKGVLRAITDGGDVDKAVDLGKGHVEARFTTEHGAEVIELQGEAAFLQERIDIEEDALSSVDKQLAGEPVQIESYQENGGVGGVAAMPKPVPPAQWQLRDKARAIFASLGLGGLIFASYFGVEATFRAAGLPIFEDHRYLSFMLAVLVVSAGISTKFIGDLFSDPAHRELYRKIIGFSGTAAFFVWVILFGSLFESISGIYDPFADPKHLLGWAFNITHIFSEVLISAALYGQLEAVMVKYAPSYKIDNAARPPLLRAKSDQLPEVAALKSRLGKVTGRLSQLEGIKEAAFIEVETAIRQRMNEQPRDTLI